MEKSKFVSKFACFEKVLKTGWGLDLYEVFPARAAYKVNTSGGSMCLKRFRARTEKLTFIKEAQNYLSARGFRNMSCLVNALDGEAYTRMGKELYILSPWVHGDEPSYTNLTHLQMAAYFLGEMHCKSKGFTTFNKVREKYSKWPKKIAKKEKELVLYEELARLGKRTFDKIFLENYEWLIARTQKAYTLLNSSAYNKVCEDAKQGYLCHGDTAMGNLIIYADEAVFIDFDAMALDLPVVDLWRLLRRSLRRNKWSPDFIHAIIKAYEEQRKLSPEEKEILLALLIFPEKAWRFAHEYYEKKEKQGWSVKTCTLGMQEFLQDRAEMDALSIASF